MCKPLEVKILISFHFHSMHWRWIYQYGPKESIPLQFKCKFWLRPPPHIRNCLTQYFHCYAGSNKAIWGKIDSSLEKVCRSEYSFLSPRLQVFSVLESWIYFISNENSCLYIAFLCSVYGIATLNLMKYWGSISVMNMISVKNIL